ncbi:LrgB family protein [Metabacillus herbersteinensis]|uniref:LrgB family protein n=1 Tax=Metabacillus herbersteinensis TaxID=283816 RepID=A0ABV6G9I9_9BACI
MNIGIALLFIVLIVGVYVVVRLLYKRYPKPLLVPIATSTFFIVCMLYFFKIPYEMFMQGGRWIDELLGPAVVALAIPLYQHRKTLKKHIVSIFSSVFVGMIVGLGSGILLSLWFDVEEVIILSLAPKSVTSPVAMDLSQLIEGIPALAAVYVMVAGISGAVLGPYLLKWFKIHHPVAVGVGYGSAAHGVGISMALEIGEEQGAVSSIAMTLSAIFTSILCPFFIAFLL